MKTPLAASMLCLFCLCSAWSAGARSGRVVLLHEGPDAFAVRHSLAGSAKTSLDLQYYIWEGDLTGSTLLQSVLDAADRGVKVRLLLDDATSSGLVGGLTGLVGRYARGAVDQAGDRAADLGLAGRRTELRRLARDLRSGGRDTVAAALDSHPNIEVRIFNPFRARGLGGGLRALELAGSFSRLNRRMHNKIFLADRGAAVTGGRNISDRYFGYDEDYNYGDLDVLVEGPAASAIADSFDQYWESPRAVPVRRFWLDRNPRVNLAALRAELAGFIASLPDRPDPRESARTHAALRARAARAQVEVVSDDPRKPDLPSRKVAEAIEARLASAGNDVLVESGFFVPTRAEYPSLEAALKRGVRVRVLTNSVASNDVFPAAVGYKRHRKRLLLLGADLREARPSGGSARTAGRGGGTSGLHTKAAVFDRRSAFIGTFNLDPRSASLNTEIALFLTGGNLPAQLAARIEKNSASAWRARLDNRRRLVWSGKPGEADIRIEPETGPGKRLKLSIFSALPLDPLL